MEAKENLKQEVSQTEYLVKYADNNLTYLKYHDKDTFTEEVNMKVFAEQSLKNQLAIMQVLDLLIEQLEKTNGS